MKRFSLPRITFWRVLGVVLVAAGAYSAIYRYLYGLGASTNLSDACPWGMWVSFNVLCGVGLSASGFTLCAVVYVLNAHRFQPLVRPVVLAALLGYISVTCTLLIELGKPLNIWHTLIMWNHHSVLFEVSWCVMLYSTVLALEFSPTFLERLKHGWLLKAAKAVTVPLVIAGVLLSMLHQSSLGSLFLIVPGKLHPLWYSPLLPVFFLVSALAVGAAMTIVISLLCARAFGRKPETPLLGEVSRWMVVALLIYLALRVLDYGHRGVLFMLLEGSLEAKLVWAELGLLVVLPVVIALIPRYRRGQGGLMVAAVCAVLGFILNRWNVSFLGIPQIRGTGYVPSLMEMSMTAGIIAGEVWVFCLAAKYLPLFVGQEDDVSAHGSQQAQSPRFASQPQGVMPSMHSVTAVGAKPRACDGFTSASSEASPPDATETIEVPCECGKLFAVAAHHAGKRGKCPSCARPLAVPMRARRR
jgi:Ni/Fe-hydrogenase subunit HybB-like protein